jgi:hypothetical protein
MNVDHFRGDLDCRLIQKALLRFESEISFLKRGTYFLRLGGNEKILLIGMCAGTCDVTVTLIKIGDGTDWVIVNLEI